MNPTSPLSHLRYFLQDEIYLLKSDKALYQHASIPPAKPGPEQPPVIEETPALSFKYLGGNQKHFLILCHYAGHDSMDEAHLAALKSTCSRLGFEQQDIAILNLAHYPAAGWQQLAQWFIPQKLLILGHEALPAGLPALALNRPHTVNNAPALYTFSFNEMMGNKENTKTFWNLIKNL